MIKHINVPIFVPHKGCPNDCVFCNQKKITGTTEEKTLQQARNTIEETLETVGKDSFVEIAFFGGSFTGIEKERQKEYLSLAGEYIKSGRASGIRISTRPDYISCKILDMLKEYGVTAVELGAQSMDDRVLELNRRGHTADDTKKAVKLLKSYGFETGLQMMTGMYGSDTQTDLFTGRAVAELMPDTVRIYPTVVLDDTYLAEIYRAGEYLPPTLEETVEVCAGLFKMFEEKNIRVIRLGLQSTDTICEKGSIVAGAYHSAMGELVRSRILREDMEKKVLMGERQIFVLEKLLSAAIGQKKENIKYFKEKYDVDIEVKGI